MLVAGESGIAEFSVGCAILASAGARYAAVAIRGILAPAQPRAPRRPVSITLNLRVVQWFGVITAISYSLFVASNIGLEFLGFVLLFISTVSIGTWAYLGGHRSILLLQFCSAVAGLIGMVRWF